MRQCCEIVGYRPKEDITELKVIVEGNLESYLRKYQKNGVVSGELQFDDGRFISSAQRKKIYAMLADIAYFSGDVPEYTKELFKFFFMASYGIEYFSLSDCSMEVAREYITFLLDFVLQHDIPISDLGVQRADDIERYLWSCIKYKRCCICGKPADIHHVDAIGKGRNRKNYDDYGHRKMALCREHHTEDHNIGVDSFNEKYHVFGVIYEEEE